MWGPNNSMDTIVAAVMRHRILLQFHDNSIGRATDYGWTADSINGRENRFSLPHVVQTGSGAHPASYPMDMGVPSPGVKYWCLKLTTHLHLVPRSRIVELRISPFPHTSLQLGA
jgi:hypothetical protein